MTHLSIEHNAERCFANAISDNEGFYILEASLCYELFEKPTYKNLTVELPKNKVTCLLGESGCGKSSLLKQIAGLQLESALSKFHSVDSDGNTIDFPNQVAYMAQHDLLMPWLTVLDNVLLSFDLTRPLHHRKKSSKRNAAVYDHARSLLDKLGLGNVEMSLPSQLSGGMRQRVALVRTLIQDKPIVLMDEPFSALDSVNRYKLQELAASFLQEKTVLLVTHDPQEALRLGEQVLLFPSASKNERASNNIHLTSASQLTRFSVPTSNIPRAINAELGALQERLLLEMGVSLC